MSSTNAAGRLLTSFLMLCVSALCWGIQPHDQPLPDYDAAGGIKMGLRPGMAPSAAQQSALLALERAVGAELRVTYNGLTGSPRTMGSSRPLTAPSLAGPESIARQFLRNNKAIWGYTDQDLDGLKLDTSYTDRHNGVTHVYFKQTEGEIPLFFGVVSVNLNSKGQILSVQGDVFPGSQSVSPASLSPEEAAELAAKHIGVSYLAKRTGTEGDAVTLEPGDLLSPIKVTPTIYALLGAPRLAHRMVLEKSGLEWYDILVDAETGEILHRRNLYQFAGQLTPSAPVEPSPAAPRGLIYVEHPLATVRGTGDLIRKYPFTVDPTGRPHGFANAPANGADTSPTNPHGGNPVNATISQQLLPLPDANSPVRSAGLPLASSPQSPQGWFIPQSGTYFSIGNNVDAKEDHAANNETTIGQRADGGATGDFTGSQFVYQNQYGENNNKLPDVPAAVLTLFYVNNWYHDILYHLGFTEAAGNFQKDNFGRGGLGNDFVFADAQDGSGTNNANFGTPVDGANPRMQMFLWTTPNRDGTVDFDIIVHEYSHGLSNRLVGGPSNVNCLSQVGLTGEGGGMGEGWGDWYATILSDEPAVAEYATGDPDGLRTNPVGNAPTDYTYGNLCTGPPSNPNPLGCEVHGAGEFWTIVLWELRESMINRYHNYAFPGGPFFPTFTTPPVGGLPPEGNIRSALGRTTDGSGVAARIDHATIENAAFAAMFRVTDAMKLSVCNPTMVTMRDSILEADRNMGGEFQDLIWRVFANRGIGMLAQSSNSEVPDPVADFTVPLTVMACEDAGGPLPAPVFTATSSSPNTVTINITPNGATEYIIMRGAQGAGTPVEPRPFEEVGRTTGTVFTDTNVDGGVTFHYRVQASRNDDCISGSVAVPVVPLGGPVPCAVDPVFLGLSSANVPGDCERVLLNWPSAVSSCQAAGPNITYNVYRGTSAAFTPDAGNRIASGVVGNSFADTPGTVGTLHYYVVRAEDSTTGNGGPANDGNEDDNLVRLPGVVTSASLVSQGFADDVESGPDNQSSAHFTSSGFLVANTPQRGGWFRDSAVDPNLVHSPSNVWHAFNPDNESVSALTSDIITVTPSSILSFYHTFRTESTFDGGVVEYALVDATGAPGLFQDMEPLIYEGRYNLALLPTPDNTNALAGRRAYTGGSLGAPTRVRAFLGALVPTGMTSQRIQIRFVFASDVAQSLPPPANTTGNFLPGWYIDDITIDESCCPISPSPRNLVATASGPETVDLVWDAPLGGGSVSQYLVLREEVIGTVPSVFDSVIASVPGTQTTYTDDAAVGGRTYAYVVRAVPAGGCASGDSNIATVLTIGVCRTAPSFTGLGVVQALPQATCGLTLSWPAATVQCPGATVRYNVYRSTNPTFTPSLSNAVALGQTTRSYVDQTGLTSGVTYYYVVRAEDSTSNGLGPANSGNEDLNLLRRSGSPRGALVGGPDFTDDLEPAANPGYTTITNRTPGWSVTSDPTAHSATQAWVVVDEAPGAAMPARQSILILPAVDLTSTSMMSFWHNFDFNRFPNEMTNQRFYTGGVLEISADGQTWLDLGSHITVGGYNGTVTSGSGVLTGKPAWVGSSDGHAVVGRADLMQQVTVDLGAAVQDPTMFNATVVPGALIRFRMGGTSTALIGGVNSGSWGVDDLSLTSLLTSTMCITGGSCVADPLFGGLAAIAAPLESTCTVDLLWSAAFPQCPGASVRYNVYRSTSASFVPGPSNDVAVGVTGTTFRDQLNLDNGVTYYYVVRAEDSTSNGTGPANGGNEDDNLVRRSIAPRGPLGPGPDFVDDLEPAPQPGYGFETVANNQPSPTWAATADPFAHSPTNSFVSDSSSLDLKDDRLIAPPMNISSASQLIFWHRFRFETSYDGGVLEVSTDGGSSWADVDPNNNGFVEGGYNGAIVPNLGSPIAGRRAWTGASRFVDAQTRVVVNVGAFAGAGVLFRWRLALDPIVPGSTPGTGWFVDDIAVTGLQTPGTCGPICTVDPIFSGLNLVTAPYSAECGLLVVWNEGVAGCPGTTLSYNIYRSTDPAFIPSPSNAVATGVSGSSYLDDSSLVSGTTYYYIVRAEDSTTGGGGPANGGNEDNNLTRFGASPQGPLAPGGPDFVDDLEPAAAAGYSTATTRQPGWAVTMDNTAHSASRSWFVPDLDSNRGFPPFRDSTLRLPAMNLSSSSIMTFWHNYDFARFPTAPVTSRYRSGGVLEISQDGSTWVDLRQHITMGGYNGTVFADPNLPGSPLEGRMAWVGSSDGDNVAGRVDAMQQVRVDLGSAIQALFSVTELPGALVRFRMGGTYQILINGIQGDGWGVDDLQVTGLLAPGECVTVRAAGLVDDLVVTHAAGGDITLTWTASCSANDFDYEIYEGSLGPMAGQGFYTHASRFCSTGGDTTRTFTPGSDGRYYLVVPRNATNEGSYGQASSGTERPAAASSCLDQRAGACN